MANVQSTKQAVKIFFQIEPGLKQKFTDFCREKCIRKYADILTDYFVEGMTYQQIGDQHGMTRERVRQIIHYSLKQMLNGNGAIVGEGAGRPLSDRRVEQLKFANDFIDRYGEETVPTRQIYQYVNAQTGGDFPKSNGDMSVLRKYLLRQKNIESLGDHTSALRRLYRGHE